MYYIVNKIPILSLINSLSENDYIDLIISLPKDIKLEELVECKLTISINIEKDVVLSHDRTIKFVENDQIIDVFIIKDSIKQLLESVLTTLKSIDQGINVIPDFYINDDLLSPEDLNIRSLLKNNIKLITDTVLHSVAIKVYYTLVDYKGSDTLQIRKQIQMYKMMESDSNSYY